MLDVRQASATAPSDAEASRFGRAGIVLLPLLLAALALIPRLRFAWASTSTIVGRAAADDGYYYFQIARNIAHGHNVTFDGETITNGFHPLWMAMITPVFFVVHGDTMPVHVILTMGSILGAIATVFIFLTLRRLTSIAAAALAAATYALHPYTVNDSVVGVETPVVVALFTAIVFLYVRAWQDGATRRDDIAIGALSGLLLLARTDTLFIVPCIWAALLLRTPTAAWRERALRFVVPAALLLLPWVVWTLAATGTIVQVSGEAGTYPARQAFLNAHGDGWWGQARHGVSLIREAFTMALPHQYLVPHFGHPWKIVVPAVLLLVTMCTLPPDAIAAKTRRSLLILLPAALGVTAALLYHAGIRWHWRTWYFAPTGVMLVMVFGIMLGHAEAWLRDAVRAVLERRARGVPSPRLVTLAAVTALYLVASVLLWRQYRPDKPERYLFDEGAQLNMLTAARWVRANTPPDARLGSFNAGIIGYYSGRTVVNLDGVVNADALNALRNCTTADYIRKMQLGYIVDFHQPLLLAYCGQDVPRYETLATVGRPLLYFAGGQLDIRQVHPDETSP